MRALLVEEAKRRAPQNDKSFELCSALASPDSKILEVDPQKYLRIVKIGLAEGVI